MRRSRIAESSFSWKTSGRDLLAGLVLVLAWQIGLVGFVGLLASGRIGFDSGDVNSRRAGRSGLAGRVHFRAFVDDKVEMRLAGHDVIGGDDFGAGADEGGRGR